MPRRCSGELLELKAVGVDVVQLDEPYLQARPDDARKFGIEAINAALDGVPGRRRCTCVSAMPTW